MADSRWSGRAASVAGMWALVLGWMVARAAGKWTAGSSPGKLVFTAAAYVATYIPFFRWARNKFPRYRCS